MSSGKQGVEPQTRSRESLRLANYDYGQPGAYFVTIVAQGRECLFGEIFDGEMDLNPAGHMVTKVWRALPSRFPNVMVDNFTVLPNHIHGIVEITNVSMPPHETTLVGAPLVGARPKAPTGPSKEERATTRVAPTLGAVIGAFKSLTTVKYTRGVTYKAWPPFEERL